jgi:peptidoglycan/xylan/chitin deacetylase (PgdA/CDA1 family)
MNRRRFLRSAAAAAAVAWGLGIDGEAVPAGPSVSVTMDDFWFAETPMLSPAERNARILAALARHRVRATAFVIGKNAEAEASAAMLAAWAKAGHTIGNHTYSHPYYAKASFDDFAADVVRAETVLARLPGYERIFRFPYLSEGDTPEKRDRMRAFLRERGYRNGHVTVDASDWYVDSRLRARLEARPGADVAPYRDFYLAHIWERAQYYDTLSREVLGRSVPHTLLVHFNLLNALFLDDLLAMFTAKGWRLIDASAAFADPVFKAEPKTVPAGQSLVWALAKEHGKHSTPLRYPAETGDYEKPKMDALGL